MSENHIGKQKTGDTGAEMDRLVSEGIGSAHVIITKKSGNKEALIFMEDECFFMFKMNCGKRRKLLKKKGMGRQRLTGCAREL